MSLRARHIRFLRSFQLCYIEFASRPPIEHSTASKGVRATVHANSSQILPTERHLPYEIVQCYLPSGTGEHALL